MSMMAKLAGQLRSSGMMKKLRGGPQSMLPMSPGKGTGVPNRSGLTPARARQYVAPKQKPNWTPVKPIRKV